MLCCLTTLCSWLLILYLNDTAVFLTKAADIPTPLLFYCSHSANYTSCQWATQDDKERKRLEALEKRREKQRLLEEEDSMIKGKQTKEPPSKVTRAQIEENQHSGQNVKETKEKEKSHLEMPLEENVNRIVLEDGTVEARTIEDAIAVLSTKEDLDRHPERRLKAAYATFEEANMPRLKMENPNMRLSQLKQQLKKEWTKSPENPLNQRVATYNSK
ncbi:coiled-coil domain-containing protein 124-like isoform X2 [Myxocyprinus asiaticus]|uniref:coiled-coil domain-containing protein 124-like isoform X2 n=1 Tax=Myxocyprinus asiaticus TaxID=70543 RepID=UPI00222259FF|nr:coiled-coil domain-containing protein 124-like isoform X2 [Myxocyprinus asiaticus]